MTHSRKLLLALTALTALSFGASVQAQSWSAANDFNAGTNTNPNGVWSYGYDPAALAGYQFQAFNAFTAGTFPSWTDSAYNTLGTPSFFRNLSGAPSNGLSNGGVALHPGPAGDDDAAILRFTVPTSDTYSFVTQFFPGDAGETLAWVVLNGNFGAPLATLGATSASPAYAALLFFNAGDTLDFVVGNAGSFFGDTTPLSMEITVAVPEPAAGWLLLAGLGALALRRRRR